MAASSKQNPGERGITVAAVRFITPDVAIADGPYEIAGSDARRWTTIVLRRETDGWRIAAIRNMTPGCASGAAPHDEAILGVSVQAAARSARRPLPS